MRIGFNKGRLVAKGQELPSRGSKPMSEVNLLSLITKNTIPGTPGDDALVGSDTADILQGEGGNDNLQGGRGDDELYGGDGLDELIGGAGNDLLDGGAGRDKLFGNSGDDTYLLKRDSGFDEIYDSIGNDTIKIDGVPSEITLSTIPSPSPILLIHLGEAVAAVRGFFSETDEGRIENIVFSDGTVWSRDKVLEILGHSNPNPNPPPPQGKLIIGNDTDELLNGTEFDDTIDGGGGNDQLHGDWGNDTYIWGRGSGHDLIADTAGQDKVSINALASEVKLSVGTDGACLFIELGNNDSLMIMGYFDTIGGVGHIETLEFADGTVWDIDDVLAILESQTPPPPTGKLIIGNDGDEYLVGTAYDDTIDGGGGNDQLVGGLGNDIYIWKPESNDAITDAGGNDEVQIGDFTGDITWSRMLGSKDLFLNINGFVLTVSGFFNEENGIERFAFANGDVLTRADILERLPTPVGEGKLIIGNDDNEHLTGTEYNDTINGGGGDDVLLGGAGDDTYIWEPDSNPDSLNSDFIHDTDGFDTVQVGVSSSKVKLWIDDEDSKSLVIAFTGSGKILYIKDYFTEHGGRIEKIVFSDGAVWGLDDVKKALDIETPPPPPPVEGKLVLGTADSETLEGTASHDTIDSGAGDDLMLGGAGDDLYRWAFGSGNDTISDSRGTDTLSIHAGSSEVQFTATGDDYSDLTISLYGQKLVIENYFLTAEDGGTIENIAFSDGQVWQIGHIWKLLQVREGGSKDDVIYGKSGKDNLKGNDGDDALFGGKGDDALAGGRGNDKLVGGSGSDVLTGGSDRDTFAFGSKSDVGLGKYRDVIVDFTRGKDKIDLSGIDANGKTSINDAFTKLLSAKQKFTAAGQLRYDAKTGILSVNTDKDAAAEFEIQLKNKPAYLKLSDFIL